MVSYIESLNHHETTLAGLFQEQLVGISHLGRDSFTTVLLEKRVLSRAFVPLYRTVACQVENKRLRDVVEEIIADEYRPDDHQKLLDEDLRMMGLYVPDAQYTAKSITLSTVLKASLNFYKRGPQSDLQNGFFLRVYGELLPGIEYDVLWPRLVCDFGLTPDTSQFYWHHKVHDEKRVELGVGGETHTDKFSQALAGLVHNRFDFHAAKQAIDTAYLLRSNFWKQFF